MYYRRTVGATFEVLIIKDFSASVFFSLAVEKYLLHVFLLSDSGTGNNFQDKVNRSS